MNLQVKIDDGSFLVPFGYRSREPITVTVTVPEANVRGVIERALWDHSDETTRKFLIEGALQRVQEKVIADLRVAFARLSQ